MENRKDDYILLNFSTFTPCLHGLGSTKAFQELFFVCFVKSEVATVIAAGDLRDTLKSNNRL